MNVLSGLSSFTDEPWYNESFIKHNDSNTREIYEQRRPVSIKLTNPIAIEGDFGIHKNATFSIRTLMLLSVVAIGVFCFGINPKLFGFELSSSLRVFAFFTLFIVVGQGVISFISYRLNRENVKAFIAGCRREVAGIVRQLSDAENNLNRTKQEYKTESDSKFLPCNIKKCKAEQDIDEQTFYNQKNVKLQRLNKEKDNIERDILALKIELKSKKSIVRNAELLYKFINGPMVFILAFIGIATAIFTIITSESITSYYF